MDGVTGLQTRRSIVITQYQEQGGPGVRIINEEIKRSPRPIRIRRGTSDNYNASTNGTCTGSIQTASPRPTTEITNPIYHEPPKLSLRESRPWTSSWWSWLHWRHCQWPGLNHGDLKGQTADGISGNYTNSQLAAEVKIHTTSLSEPQEVKACTHQLDTDDCTCDIKTSQRRTDWRESCINILFWLTLLITTVGCIIFSIYGAVLMDPEASKLMLVYFQPVLPPLFMLWLWAHNIWVFERKEIDYDACYQPQDRLHRLTAVGATKVALVLTTVTSIWGCVFAATAMDKKYTDTAKIPVALYCSLGVVMVFPLNTLYRSSRLFFVKTWLLDLFLLNNVTWAKFLVADMFTSLAISVQMFTQAFCYLSTGPAMQKLTDPAFVQVAPQCSSGSLLSLFSLSFPYGIRLLQCFIVFCREGNPRQGVNALKYFFSIAAWSLRVLQFNGNLHDASITLRTSWIAVQTVASLFNWYWDVEMDFGMPWVTCYFQGGARRGQSSNEEEHGAMEYDQSVELGIPLGFKQNLRRKCLMMMLIIRNALPFLPPMIAFPCFFYWWACLSDLVMRLVWTTVFVGSSILPIPLIYALIEVIRRYQWIFLRIETELRKVHYATVFSADISGLIPSTFTQASLQYHFQETQTAAWVPGFDHQGAQWDLRQEKELSGRFSWHPESHSKLSGPLHQVSTSRKSFHAATDHGESYVYRNRKSFARSFRAFVNQLSSNSLFIENAPPAHHNHEDRQVNLTASATGNSSKRYDFDTLELIDELNAQATADGDLPTVFRGSTFGAS